MDERVASGRTAQYVILGVERERFAIEVDCVREILDFRPITRVPRAPECMSGMIDVRGKTVPVIDLRVRFGLPAVEPSPATRIIVLNVRLQGRLIVVGMMVDRVHEVSALSERALEAPPDIGLRWRSSYIKSIGRSAEAFVIVVDLARLLESEEAVLIGDVPEESAA